MSDQGIWGQKGITDDSSLFRHIVFLVRQMFAERRSSIPVKILKVHGGGVDKAPTVDVQVMVKQMDGVGNASSHSTIYGIPAARNQGGLNAVINDPIVGDTGHLVIADRDISSWKANDGAESNPGSFRRSDLSDGVYHHAVCIPGKPKQYVQFLGDDGILVHDKTGNEVFMNSGKVYVKPANGLILYLGGTGSDGSYAFVETVSGPSINVKARTG